MLHAGNAAVTKTDMPFPRPFWEATRDVCSLLFTLQALSHAGLDLVLRTTLKYRYDYPLFLDEVSFREI